MFRRRMPREKNSPKISNLREERFLEKAWTAVVRNNRPVRRRRTRRSTGTRRRGTKGWKAKREREREGGPARTTEERTMVERGRRNRRWRAGLAFCSVVQLERVGANPRIRHDARRTRKGIGGSWNEGQRDRGRKKKSGTGRERKKKSHPLWRLKAMSNQRPTGR